MNQKLECTPVEQDSAIFKPRQVVSRNTHRWRFNWLSPDVPVVSTFGASSMKSSAWQGVVFVALVVGMMAMGHGAWAESIAFPPPQDAILLAPDISPAPPSNQPEAVSCKVTTKFGYQNTYHRATCTIGGKLVHSKICVNGTATKCAENATTEFLEGKFEAGGYTGPLCEPPSPDMIAWYPFDETSGTTAHDIIGGYDGVLENSPIPITGKVGGALSFSTYDQRMVVDNLPADALYYKGGDFSIDFWIGSGTHNVVWWRGKAQPQSHGCSWSIGLGHDIHDGIVFCGDGMCYVPFEECASTNGWNHIALTVNESGKRIFYINGQQCRTDNFIDSYNQCETYPIPHLVVGDGGDGVDELQIFDRALSPEEVKAIYDADSVGTCGKTLIKGTVWHDFNDDGVHDENEPPLSGATVSYNYTQTTTTDSSGHYTFPNITSFGKYYIYAQPQTGQKITYPSDIFHTGNIQQGQKLTLDIGLAGPGSINGTIWYDDGDGVKEEGESNVGSWYGVKLHYKLPNGMEGDFIEYTYDSEGNYSFEDLSFAGTYTISIEPSAGYEISYPKTIDNVHIIELERFQTVMDIDFGIAKICPDKVCHVSTTGLDTNDGSEAKPFATIQHGIDVAKDGYTVLVHSGTYIENINFNGKNIIVKSTDGAENTVIDGNQNGSVVQFINAETSTTVLNGFTLTNGSGTHTNDVYHEYWGGGIYTNKSNPTVMNLKITGNSASAGGGIATRNSGPMIFNSIISDNTANFGGGIYYSHVIWTDLEKHPVIENTIISKNKAHGGAGITVNYTSRPILTNVTITENVITKTGSSNYNGGAMWRGNGSGVTMSNSIIWNNSSTQIYWAGGDTWTSQISYSDIEGGETGKWITWGDGNLDTDPLFVNGYHLSDYSPAVGAGTSTNAPETDLEGTQRPNPTGSNPDIGAYENLLGTPQQQLACSAEPTIKSVNSGFWDSPNTWSENRVPGINDVVAIQKDHFIRIKTSYNTTMIDGLCNHGMLTNWYKYWFANGYIHGYANMFVYAKSFIDNYGKIQGIDGYPYFYEGGHGSNVYLRTNGNLNNYTDAKILSGKGRSNSWRNGNGGYVATLAKNITNDGVIGAGDSDKGYGGMTVVRAFDKLLHTGLIHNGKSGNGKYSYLYVKAYNKIIMGSIIGYGYVMIDPATISILGADAKIEGKEITIYGGENTVIEMKDLAEGAISSTGNITLAVGSGGNIDLSGITGKVFNTTSEVKIYTDNLKLNENVDITNLIEASNIETAPAKIIYDVMVLAPDQLAGQQGETISINVTVANNGPETDTYNIVVTDANGWNLGTLPATVTLNGAETQELDLQVTLPTSQADNVITLTVTSQADSTVSKTIAVQVSAVAEFAEETEIDEEEAKVIMGDHKASGQLLDKSGNPVSGAIVKVGDKTTVTDATGHWELIGLNKGDYTVEISKEGYNFEPTNFNVADSNVELEVITGQPDIVYAIHGTILDDFNNPITNITLQVDNTTTNTDALGNWEIQGLQEGAYTITAEKDGYTFMPLDFEVGNEQLWTKLMLKPLTQLKVKITPKTRGKKAEQGKNLTYRIDVINGGDKEATGGTIIYQIPTGTSLVKVNGIGKVTCENTATTVTCTIPDLKIGATAKIDIVLDIGVTESNLFNVVTLNSNEYPVDIGKNWTKVKPYLSIFGKARPSPVEIGGTLHYTFDVELNDNASNGKTEATILTVTLPKDLTFKSAPANCDTSNLPVISCPIGTLSVENPEDTSKVTINIDTLAEELGLIKLITKAEVTADNYATHVSKVNTSVFTNGIEVDGVVVIDVTHSMSKQLNGVIKEINRRIEVGFANGAEPFVAIVSFRDQDDIEVVAATKDINTLLAAVESLEAKDGGLCPEASADALMLALNHLKRKGTLLFITDAPPYSDAETQATLERVKQLILDKDINFVPIISEDGCSAGSSN